MMAPKIGFVDITNFTLSSVLTGGNDYLWNFGDSTSAETDTPTINKTFNTVGKHFISNVVNFPGGAGGPASLEFESVTEPGLAGYQIFTTFSLDGTLVFAADTRGNVLSYIVSGSSLIFQHVIHINNGQFCQDISFDGTYVYCAWTGIGLILLGYDATTGFTLLDTKLDSAGSTPHYDGLYFSNGLIYVAANQDGVRAYSVVANALQLEAKIGRLVDNAFTEKLWVRDGIIHAANGSGGICALQKSGASFTILDSKTEVDIASGIDGEYKNGHTYLYVALGSHGIHAYEWSGSSYSLITSWMTDGGYAADVCVFSPYIIAVDYGLFIAEFNGTTITQVMSDSLSDWVNGFMVNASMPNSSRIFTASLDYGIGFYELVSESGTAGSTSAVKDPNPVLINNLPLLQASATDDIFVINEPISFFDDTEYAFNSYISKRIYSFPGNTSVSAAAPINTIQHTFNAAGNFNCTLITFDISGNSATDNLNITILSAHSAAVDNSIKYPFRMGADKQISLSKFLPFNYIGTDIEGITNIFENFLNTLFVDVPSYSANNIDLGNNVTCATFISPYADKSVADAQKISILEKVKRLADLHDPNLIDSEYFQLFANLMGYNLNVYKSDIGFYSPDSTTPAADQDRYIRFSLDSLPNWYKIKTTRNAIKIMLYSFGLIGDIIYLYTNNYLPLESGGNWTSSEWETIQDSLDKVPEGYYPTPHFLVKVNLDSISSHNDFLFDFAKRDQIIRAIEDVKPINTVFRYLNGYVSRNIDLGIKLVPRYRRRILIKNSGITADYYAPPFCG